MFDYKPKGFDHAAYLLEKAEYEHRKYLVYYDSDIDGLCAGTMVMEMLKAKGITAQYYINENRQHGFKLPFDKLSGYLIIAVDFMMSEMEIESVVKAGADLINIDHHLNVADVQSGLLVKAIGGSYGVLINNHYRFEPSYTKFLSGTGMTFATFKAIYPDIVDTKDNRAMVGWSLLSDICPIENATAKYFLDELYSWDTPLGQYLLDISKPDINYGFGSYRIDREYTDFTLSPKINALFRLNKGDYAVNILRNTEMPLSVVRSVLTKALDYQKEVKSYLQAVSCEHMLSFSDLNVCFVPLPYTLYANYIGLLGTALTNANSKTTIVLSYDSSGNNFIRGSLRGYYDVVDYMSLCINQNFVMKGHELACGILSMPSNYDFGLLNEQFKFAESANSVAAALQKRVATVSNLITFGNYRLSDFALYNTYVRSNQAKMINYTGNSFEKEVKDKMYLYHIDGIVVKSFDDSLTPETSYIVPMKSRGYDVFYLNKRK